MDYVKDIWRICGNDILFIALCAALYLTVNNHIAFALAGAFVFGSACQKLATKP